MTEPKLNYIGALPRDYLIEGRSKFWWQRLPTGFLVVVALPTLIAAIYNLFIASPIYVSEARFLVRSPGHQQASGLGMALQGVGLASGVSDSFAVQEYITSRDSLNDLKRRFDIEEMIGSKEADILSRYPQPGSGRSNEALYKGFRRFVTIGYDSGTGISTLRVRAFNAHDAYQINNALLEGGEQLVNRLNSRSADDIVADAIRTEDEARTALAVAQERLTEFRTREGYIDPSLSARESSELIGGLLATIAQLKAERDQLQLEAPASPSLPGLNGRIAAYERQVAAERTKIAGSSGSLAPSIGSYQTLELALEMADRQVVQAASAVLTAKEESRRQNLYLDRIVNPNLPDSPTLPRRWYSIMTMFVSALLLYALGWLVIAGVREHGQD